MYTLCELKRGGSPDPTRGACDDGDLSCMYGWVHTVEHRCGGWLECSRVGCGSERRRPTTSVQAEAHPGDWLLEIEVYRFVGYGKGSGLRNLSTFRESYTIQAGRCGYVTSRAFGLAPHSCRRNGIGSTLQVVSHNV